MFEFKSTRELLIEELHKNADLRAALDKTNADVEYIAMMTDVELDSEDEFEEKEVEDNGEV